MKWSMINTAEKGWCMINTAEKGWCMINTAVKGWCMINTAEKGWWMINTAEKGWWMSNTAEQQYGAGPFFITTGGLLCIKSYSPSRMQLWNWRGNGFVSGEVVFLAVLCHGDSPRSCELTCPCSITHTLSQCCPWSTHPRWFMQISQVSGITALCTEMWDRERSDVLLTLISGCVPVMLSWRKHSKEHVHLSGQIDSTHISSLEFTDFIVFIDLTVWSGLYSWETYVVLAHKNINVSIKR